jgi:hypothetical protein
MLTLVRNDRGGALVTALFFITGLTAIASIIVFITGSERKVAHNEYTHVRAFNSSDAGSEEGINFVRVLSEAPLDADGTKIVDQDTYTVLYDPDAYTQEENKFQYDVTLDGMGIKPGWDPERYVFGDFTVDAEGASAKASSSVIEVQATRRFETGY